MSVLESPKSTSQTSPSKIQQNLERSKIGPPFVTTQETGLGDPGDRWPGGEVKEQSIVRALTFLEVFFFFFLSI